MVIVEKNSKIGEIDEMIKATLQSLSGKSLEEKVEIVYAQLKVWIDIEEVKYPLVKLDAIIKARIIEKCPTCNGEVIVGGRCSDCRGEGYLPAYKAEQVLLKKIKENAKGG